MSESRPVVTGFFHEPTFSVAYLVEDPETKSAAIIDPVLDFDEKAGRVSTSFADRMLEEVRARDLKIAWILDSHPHADHLSAAAYLKDRLDAPTGIGEKVIEVQKLWKGIYNIPEFAVGGAYWDRLFAEGDRFEIGRLEAGVMFSPGHTLASITYRIGDAAFVHDTLFQPDFGTARSDFPGGDAAMLYRSIKAILALPEETRLFTGHDYMPGGRPPAWESTVAQQRRENVHLRDDPDEARFVARRTARDATLEMPKLILHALQVNMRGGRLPEPESNGVSYLKIPIGVL